ncbi:ABC transporter permease [Actinomycetospora cinnamomea]|uniref:ABC transporter permease n=1 Tax=Actinomycetospora cinnamomea TaxID=663609 RepID=UPI001FAFB6CD|nr:ABC transporter permease [Actinomycetospora cinnamomea]
MGPGQGRAFLGVLGRDLAVTGKEFGSFISQVLVQPFFLLFVFGVVLGQLGYVTPDYAQLLLPGLLALNAFFVAVQATALPLVIDFSYTKEIEDRLLAPLSTRLVAVEKIVFGAMRGLFGSLVMIPVGYLVLDRVDWDLSGLPWAAVLLVLGSLSGGAAGLVIGTLVSPRRINVVFAVVITPLLFTGSTQFPFLQLENLRWFQVICAFNPITYVSEGLRGALTPAVPHLPAWICLLALLASCVLFGAIGLRGFLRRALD